jgi:ABC transporter DrrB family efflux protein
MTTLTDHTHDTGNFDSTQRDEMAATTSLPRRVSPGLALSQCLTLAWRGVVKIRRNPWILADVVVTPIMFLGLFVYVFGGAIEGSTRDYLQFVFPGIVGMMTMFATLGIGTALSRDLEQGVFDRFRTLPTLRIAPLAGAIGGDVIRQLVGMVVLVTFGVILGFRFQTNAASALAAFGLALAFAMALSWVWVLIATMMKSSYSMQGLGNTILFPLVFASNVFVQKETLPGWMQAFVDVNPARYLMDALRGLMLGGPVASPVTYTLLWMAGFVIVFAPLALVAYRRRA